MIMRAFSVIHKLYKVILLSITNLKYWWPKLKKVFNLYPATTIQSRGKISDCSTASFPLKQFKAMEKDNQANKDKMT